MVKQIPNVRTEVYVSFISPLFFFFRLFRVSSCILLTLGIKNCLYILLRILLPERVELQSSTQWMNLHWAGHCGTALQWRQCLHWTLQILSSALSDAITAPVHPPVSVISRIFALLSCEQSEGMSIFAFAC